MGNTSPGPGPKTAYHRSASAIAKFTTVICQHPIDEADGETLFDIEEMLIEILAGQTGTSPGRLAEIHNYDPDFA